MKIVNYFLNIKKFIAIDIISIVVFFEIMLFNFILKTIILMTKI